MPQLRHCAYVHPMIPKGAESLTPVVTVFLWEHFLQETTQFTSQSPWPCLDSLGPGGKKQALFPGFHNNLV